MRKYLLVFSLVFLQSIAYGQELLDGIVAIVDENVILQSELLNYTRQFALETRVDFRQEPEKLQELEKQVLQELVLQKVLLVKAKEDSVLVDDKQIVSVLDEQVNGMIQQVGSQEKLEQEFGLPMRLIRKRLREQIEERALVDALKNKKLSEININRREIQDFYKTYKDSLPDLQPTVSLSHILMSVKAGPEARSKALARIKEIQKRIEAGDDFGELARQVSDDPGSRTHGGDLGFTERGEFVKPYEEAAYAMEVGETSDIVETQFGFHIIQLLDRRGERIQTRHILVQLPKTAEDEKRTLAFLDSLKMEIENGNMTFAEVAREYSEDPESSKEGGNLGMFEVGQISIPEFKTLAENLEVGQISRAFKGQFGCHIVKLNSRTESRELSLDEDYDKISAYALNAKRDRVFREWVDEVKSDLFIKINE